MNVIRANGRSRNRNLGTRGVDGNAPRNPQLFNAVRSFSDKGGEGLVRLARLCLLRWCVHYYYLKFNFKTTLSKDGIQEYPLDINVVIMVVVLVDNHPTFRA